MDPELKAKTSSLRRWELRVVGLTIIVYAACFLAFFVGIVFGNLWFSVGLVLLPIWSLLADVVLWRLVVRRRKVLLAYQDSRDCA